MNLHLIDSTPLQLRRSNRIRLLHKEYHGLRPNIFHGPTERKRSEGHVFLLIPYKNKVRVKRNRKESYRRYIDRHGQFETIVNLVLIVG